MIDLLIRELEAEKLNRDSFSLEKRKPLINHLFETKSSDIRLWHFVLSGTYGTRTIETGIFLNYPEINWFIQNNPEFVEVFCSTFATYGALFALDDDSALLVFNRKRLHKPDFTKWGFYFPVNLNSVLFHQWEDPEKLRAFREAIGTYLHWHFNEIREATVLGYILDLLALRLNLPSTVDIVSLAVRVASGFKVQQTLGESYFSPKVVEWVKTVLFEPAVEECEKRGNTVPLPFTLALKRKFEVPSLV